MKFFLIIFLLIPSIAQANRIDVMGGGISSGSSGVNWSDPLNAPYTGWTKSGTNVKLTTITDNVGIGVTNPAYKLVVSGDIYQPLGVFRNSLGACITDSYFGSCSPGDGNFQVEGEVTLGIGSPSDNGSNKLNIGGSTSMGQDYFLLGGIDDPNGLSVEGNVAIGTYGANGRLVVYGGNVGIGVNAPGKTLDVNGTVRMTGFNIASGAGSGKLLTSDSNGNGTWVSPATSGTVTSVGLSSPNSTLTIGSSPITSSGTITNDINLTHANTWTGQQIFNTANVGVGTTIPGQKLEVKGTIRSLGEDVIGNVGIGTTLTTPVNLTVGKVSSNNGLLTVNGLSVFNSTVTVNGSFVIDALNGIEDSNAYLLYGPQTTSGNDGELELGDPNGAYNGVKIDIDQLDQNIYMNSNVGIGVNPPGANLDVSGSVRLANHLLSIGSKPTVALNDCGSTTQGTVTTGSTDLKGAFTVGTLAVTSCAITFAIPFNKTPTCLTQDDTNILATKATATTTKLTTVGSVSLSGDTVSYHCIE